MKRYFASIKQYSWILLVCVVIAGGAGYVLAKSQPVSYQVTSIMFVDVGAPGTTFSSTGAATATAADSLTTAANYSAEILTRSVMDYVFQTYPAIGKRGYTADDLLVDVLPVASVTSPTISITGIASTPSDAVLLANSVANGFQSYNQKQFQDHLDLLRGNILSQLAVYQKQNTTLENEIQQLNNPTDPRTALWTTDRNDVIHNIDALTSQLQSLPTTINSDVYVVQNSVNSDAQPSSKASTIVAATAGVGLLVGLVIMFLMIFLDSRLRYEEQVKEKLGLAYVGNLSTNTELGKTPTRVSGEAAGQVGDILANLRLTGVLAGKWQVPSGAVLLVTSPRTAEGKSTLVAALSTIFAGTGGSVVVIDSDLRHPATHLTFGLTPGGIGLAGLLRSSGQTPLDEAVMRSAIPNVWLLPAGAVVNESAFLISQKMPALLNEARKKADLVIIDGPALTGGADASLLAQLADGVILVVDTRHEKLPQLLRAKELLRSLAHTPAGVVMNRFTRSRSKGKQNYYASAFPADLKSEGWGQVAAIEHQGNGNGNGNGNGHSYEQVMGAGATVVPSSPSLSGLFKLSPPLSSSIPPALPIPPVSPVPPMPPMPPGTPNRSWSGAPTVPSSPRRLDITPPPTMKMGE